MNKNQAMAWVDELTKLLKDKNLTTIHVVGSWYFHTRQNQEIENISFFEYDHEPGRAALTVSDSYGVYAGIDNIKLVSEERMVLVEDKNGNGEHIWSAWIISDPDEDESIYNDMREAHQRLRRVR